MYEIKSIEYRTSKKGNSHHDIMHEYERLAIVYKLSIMLEQLEKNILKKLELKLTRIVRDLADSIDEKTPEDTFELISRNQVEMPHIEGESMKARVFNDDPKWVYVEYWQDPNTYNYYKQSWRRNGGSPFYSGVGAKMFTRSWKEQKQDIITQLHS